MLNAQLKPFNVQFFLFFGQEFIRECFFAQMGKNIRDGLRALIVEMNQLWIVQFKRIMAALKCDDFCDQMIPLGFSQGLLLFQFKYQFDSFIE
jgi:hypothetical protein